MEVRAFSYGAAQGVSLMLLRSGNRCIRFKSSGATLGEIAATGADQIGLCMINGVVVADWRNYRPEDRDEILLQPASGFFAVPLWVMLVMMAISLTASLLMHFLMPGPKTPNQGKQKSSYGIAGLSNTTEEGTPKMFIHGTRRIFPHIIGSRNDVSDDGRHMKFGVLYLVGGTGGDGYEDVRDPAQSRNPELRDLRQPDRRDVSDQRADFRHDIGPGVQRGRGRGPDGVAGDLRPRLGNGERRGNFA
jgi:hypothetical protein